MTTNGLPPNLWPSSLVTTLAVASTGTSLIQGWQSMPPATITTFSMRGVFVTQLSCEADDTTALLERIVGIYTEATGGLDTAEVDQARNKLLSRVVLAGERPRQRLFSVGLEWSHLGRYRSVADDLATLDGLSRDNLHRVLTRWPLTETAATVLAGPLDAAATTG